MLPTHHPLFIITTHSPLDRLAVEEDSGRSEAAAATGDPITPSTPMGMSILVTLTLTLITITITVVTLAPDLAVRERARRTRSLARRRS